MARIDDESKRQRKERVHLIVAAGNGLRELEIAQRAGLEPRTTNNYLRELEIEGHLYKDGVLWHALDVKQTKLRSFELSPQEAYTLYLATRLLVKQHDKRNEPAETAMLKLARVLTSDLGVGREIEQAARELAQRDTIPGYQSVFRTMVQGYLYRRRVDLYYRPLGKSAFRTTFDTYLMEPSALGYATYAIGHSSIVGKLRSYKLERIESAQLTQETYQIPADFPGLEVLRHSWSIIMGEETKRVVLRFSPQVRERVKETQWHPSQNDADDAERPGWLRWWVDVADITDMLPWIRGWGADCEVIGPDELRNQLTTHVRNMGIIYGVTPPPSQVKSSFFLWAKADRKTLSVHRLVYHMLDVGLTAQALWNQSLHPRLKRDLAKWLQLSEEEAGRLVAFLASLHDLGKASPAFQDHPWMPDSVKRRILAELQSAGLSFPSNRPRDEKRTRHEVLSTWSLRSVDGEQLLSTIGGLPAELAGFLAQALGGHHGAWPRPDRFSPNQLTPTDKGGKEWSEARAILVQAMRRVFEPPQVMPFTLDPQRDNVPVTLLSAIVAAADWIGSQEESFPLEEQVLPLEAYVRHARLHAQCALARVQWEPPASMPIFEFEQVFPFSPNAVQREIIAALEKAQLPAMAIIEAPMGLGKTEAALAVYASWAKAMQQAGIYIAMPTTATSNQMHGRAAQFLTKQLGQGIEPLLVHGQALLQKLPIPNEGVEEKVHDGDAAAAQSWFLPRKKSLLAPYGVGTVDQALMSILQTKHFFVRLLGLSHKVVVFDEVHAYDAYMSELFERLLTWLRAVGASVIILSATLPDKTRQKLVRAYVGDTQAIAPEAMYPRLTFACADGRVDALSLTPPPAKNLHFDWLPRAEEAIIARLRVSLADGGCAAVICNTVTRAQEIFKAIRDLEGDEKLCNDENLILFHARFPMAWREEIEEKVLRKFGPGPEKGNPNPNRPRKAIVVATQVIEQSLDLDFDVMISDHAPVDLLLQRSGRLQRHSVNDPRAHPNCLWIAEPPVEEGVPRFERSDTYVYDKYVLLRSWLALKNILTRSVEIPGSVDDLIKAVYGDEESAGSSAIKAALAEAKSRMESDQFGERVKARKRRTPKPDDEDLLWGDNLELEEDDPTVHETFQAMTRSDRPGLSVVCLHRMGEKLYIDPDDTNTTYDPAQPPDQRLIRNLARHTLSIRRPDIEGQLLAEPNDEQMKAILKQWRRIAALRYHRVVIFEKGVYPLPGTSYVLHLHKENQLGLQISKEAP